MRQRTIFLYYFYHNSVDLIVSLKFNDITSFTFSKNSREICLDFKAQDWKKEITVLGSKPETENKNESSRIRSARLKSSLSWSGLVWWCADVALMMHWWCADDALTRHRWCTDNALMMHWWCNNDSRMMRWWCTNDALMMRWWCADDALMMHWWCANDSLMMHEYHIWYSWTLSFSKT